jgi:hypothetical protein
MRSESTTSFSSTTATASKPPYQRARPMRRERTAYIRRHFGASRLDPHLYHLMVNAGLGEDSAVSAILAALETGTPGPA